MTVKSNQRNSVNRGSKPKKSQGAQQKTSPKVKGPQVPKSPAEALSGVAPAEVVAAAPVVVATPTPEAIETTRDMQQRPVVLARPVSGRQWNDSRIPSLEDHVRIVQMLYGTDRKMKKAAKDLAKRLDVSQKEALEALRACS